MVEVKENEAENDVQGEEFQSVLPISATDKQSDSIDITKGGSTDGGSTELTNQVEITKGKYSKHMHYILVQFYG